MVSELWEPIQKYIDTLNNRSMPVHHYTTLQGALGILRTGQAWFTERTHLNDPSEISHGVEIAEAILNERNRAQDAKRLRDSAMIVFRDFRFFSASFSFECDDFSQWKSYADDGRGMVLSFRASAFNNPKAHVDKFISGNPTALVCPMSYDRATLKEVIEAIIQGWNGTDVGELCDHVFMISSMFKDSCWKSEVEYRFFIHHRRETILKSDCYRTRERNGLAISFLELPIQNWGSKTDFPIYRICLGPAAPDSLDAQVSDFIFSVGLPIQREHITRSNIPYRPVRQI